MQGMLDNHDLDKKNKKVRFDSNLLIERIKELRKEHNLTQIDLAERLGKTRGAVGHWETSRREPDLDTIYKIAVLFDVTVDYLIGKSDLRNSQKAADYILKKVKEAGYIKDGKIQEEDIENFIKDLKLIKQINGGKK